VIGLLSCGNAHQCKGILTVLRTGDAGADIANAYMHAALITPRAMQTWLKAFFGAAALQDMRRQVGHVEPPSYSLLSRACSTVFCTYTFDPLINFHGAEGQAPWGIH
jgi:hypothetical protein